MKTLTLVPVDNELLALVDGKAVHSVPIQNDVTDIMMWNSLRHDTRFDALLSALGLTLTHLTPWQENLIAGAIANTKIAREDIGLSPNTTPELLNIIQENRDLFSLTPLNNPGLLVDESRGKTYADHYVCELAEEYGWQGQNSPLTDEQAAEWVDDALDYLNEYAVASGYYLTFIEPGDLWLKKEDAEQEEGDTDE